MKYSKKNPPLVCMATQSACYTRNKGMTIRGVLWHSTGANNKTLKRYVQPSDNDPNKDKLLELIGVNPNHNHQNRTSNVSVGLNAWIGTLADGTVTSIQLMPWNYAPWGCGAGGKGSCNNGWIQFEICEDDLTDKNYFNTVYNEAIELTAYLCKLYNLDPKGTVNFQGVNVPVILCHRDSATYGLGSAHADVLHWFKKYNKTMNDVRNDVAKLLANSSDEVVSEPVSTPVIPTSTVKNWLEEGDKSAAVKTLQENLIKLGFSCGPDGADGEFGPNTKAAVINFQKSKNITADGIVGEKTQNAIEKALKEKTETKPTTSTPAVIANDTYRVRLAWNSPKSQIGAFKKLEYAINLVNTTKNDYKVYNSKGEVVYSKNNEITDTITPTSSTTETPTVVTPATIYSGVKLGSASHDESGTYRGGKAGDQNGTEVAVQNWYLGNWDTVLRPNDAQLAENIAAACEKACNNNNIGYDQYQRNTLLAEAKKVNMDISKITTPCECDCSSLVSTCCVCAGLPESIFFAGGNGRTTWTIQNACEQTGKFTVLKDSKYTRQKDYLRRGDILLQTDMHVVTVLSNGNNAEPFSSTSELKPTTVSYVVAINTDRLNVRSGPGETYDIKTTVSRNWRYTIVAEENGWGKLKSGAGWINLSYTKKI